MRGRIVAKKAVAGVSDEFGAARTVLTDLTQLVKVQNFNVSRDGFGAGETASWPNRTAPGGSRGLDDYLTRDFANNIGAEIMGRNKFGPRRGPRADHKWLGWWGDEPPFHTPVLWSTTCSGDADVSFRTT